MMVLRNALLLAGLCLAFFGPACSPKTGNSIEQARDNASVADVVKAPIGDVGDVSVDCHNERLDSGEEAVDCGGPCSPCVACRVHADCGENGFCDSASGYL